MMNPVSQETNPDASLIVPVLRKRGRPRKDPSERRAQRARPRVTRVPPGYQQMNFTHSPQIEPVNSATENMTGHAVTGVVEATFDDGYLLAVRIGNSNHILRGVVFKPGHAAPVTAENDVAPHVELIRRNEVHFPAAGHGRKRRSRETNMQLVTYMGNGSPLANQMVTSSPSVGNYGLAPSVPPVGARGTVVPVVLQPSTNQPAPHLRASKFNPVPLAVHPPNGSASQASESQTSSHVTPTGSGNENGLFKQVAGSNPIKPNVVRVKTELLANQDGEDKAGSDATDMNEPLFVEPLQTRHTIHHFQPASLPGHVLQNGPGRMSQLLQAVQQNSGDARNGYPAAVHNVGQNNDETGRSHAHFQTGSM